MSGIRINAHPMHPDELLRATAHPNPARSETEHTESESDLLARILTGNADFPTSEDTSARRCSRKTFNAGECTLTKDAGCAGTIDPDTLVAYALDAKSLCNPDTLVTYTLDANSKKSSGGCPGMFGNPGTPLLFPRTPIET